MKTWLGWGIILILGLRHRPEVVICDLPMTLRIGWYLKRKLGCKLIYYPFELFGEQSFPVPIRWKRWEQAALERGIDVLITQNSHRAEVYEKERKSRVKPVVVRNFKQKPEKLGLFAGNLRRLLGIAVSERIVLYEGLLIPGRSLENVLQATVFFPPQTYLVIMGTLTPWWEKTVRPFLKNPEIARRVRILPPVPQAELLETIADADAGIIIYDEGIRNNHFCEPGKLSDYIFAGIPVVAPDFPTVSPLIREYQIGHLFSSSEPQELAKTITAVLSTRREEWLSRLRRAAEELNWESQVPSFLQAIKDG